VRLREGHPTRYPTSCRERWLHRQAVYCGIADAQGGRVARPIIRTRWRMRRMLTIAWCAGIAGLLAPMSTDGRTQQSTTTFKNIKVFDGLSDQQIDDAMMYMRASLGVQCEHCHDDKDWSLDTKEEKRTAREMIRMVRDLNRQLNDDLAVSCYT